MRIIGILIGGKITTHMGSKGTENYMTACGLSSWGEHERLNQKFIDVPDGIKINCDECKDIFRLVSKYKVSDFEKDLWDVLTEKEIYMLNNMIKR
jgi:hypothetical protein